MLVKLVKLWQIPPKPDASLDDVGQAMVAVTTTTLINEIDKILFNKVVLSLLKITVTGISNEIFVLYHPKIQDEDPYLISRTITECLAKPDVLLEYLFKNFRRCAQVHCHIVKKNNPHPTSTSTWSYYKVDETESTCMSLSTIILPSANPPLALLSNSSAARNAAHILPISRLFRRTSPTVIPTDHTFHIKCRWIHGSGPHVAHFSSHAQLSEGSGWILDSIWRHPCTYRNLSFETSSYLWPHV